MSLALSIASLLSSKLAAALLLPSVFTFHPPSPSGDTHTRLLFDIITPPNYFGKSVGKPDFKYLFKSTLSFLPTKDSHTRQPGFLRSLLGTTFPRAIPLYVRMRSGSLMPVTNIRNSVTANPAMVIFTEITD